MTTVAYEDELIIKKRRELEKSKHCSIPEGIYAGEILLEFEEMHLEDKNFKMYLPVLLMPMDEDVIRMKYPMEQRPRHIWSDEAAAVTFSLQFLEQDMGEADPGQIRDSLGNTILSVHPDYLFTDKGMVKRENGEGAWAEFLSPSVGGMLYNFMYTDRWRGELLLAMFNCPAKDKHDWKRAVTAMLESIEEDKEK